jgi:hypothetical protein
VRSNPATSSLLKKKVLSKYKVVYVYKCRRTVYESKLNEVNVGSKIDVNGYIYIFHTVLVQELILRLSLFHFNALFPF